MTTRRAVVLKAAGDQEIAGAIMDGITRTITPLNDKELAVVKAELAKIEAAYGVMKPRDDRYWTDKIAALDAKYGSEPEGRMREMLTVVWATIWDFIYDWFKYFQAWNREA